VVVRMGATRDDSAWDHEEFITSILDAFPK
jgi:hypothetical protein